MPGGHSQIWYMALSPGQKDLARGRRGRQQDILPDTAFPHSVLEVEAGGPTLFLPSLVRSKWWFLEESMP